MGVCDDFDFLKREFLAFKEKFTPLKSDFTSHFTDINAKDDDFSELARIEKLKNSELARLIKTYILANYYKIASCLNLDREKALALCLLSKNSRKRFSLNRKVPHFKASGIINELLSQGLLTLEKTKEQKPLRHRYQRIPKSERNYVAQDKILFKSHFVRFYFYFLKPNEDLIKKGEFESVLETIFRGFEYYQSLCFEQVGKELLAAKFGLKNVSSYWHKDIEVDFYYEKGDFCILGEAKFKNRKICKNVFHLLQHKALALRLKPNFFVLFSKSGFSGEFFRKKERNLLLFDINDLKFLL